MAGYCYLQIAGISKSVIATDYPTFTISTLPIQRPDDEEVKGAGEICDSYIRMCRVVIPEWYT